MFMKDGSKERYLILSLEPRRVQLYYVHSGGFLECSDGIEPHQGHWTNIKIDYGSDDTWGLIVNGGKRHTIRKYKIDYSIHCSDSIMIGDIASTVLVCLHKIPMYIYTYSGATHPLLPSLATLRGWVHLIKGVE